MADVELILPRELQPATDVFPTDALVIDNGAGVYRGTPVQIVDAGAPVPSEAVAIAGTDNTSRMTPLRVKQVIGDAVLPQVEQAKAWAQSPTAPDPSDPSSKSAKTWANEAKSLYDGLVTYLQTDAQMASLFIPANVPVIQRMPSAQSGGQVAPLNMLSWWRRSAVPTSEPYFTTADGGVWVQTGLREQDVLAALQSGISNALFDPAYAGVQPFASLAEFNAAVIPGPVNRVSVRVGALLLDFIRGPDVQGIRSGWMPSGDFFPDYVLANTTPGVTNMRFALQWAVGNAASVYRRAYLPSIYLAETSFTLNLGTTLYGDPTSVDSTNRAGWMSKLGAVVLADGATIGVGNGSAIDNILLRKKGVNTGAVTQSDADGWMGTAVNITSSGATISNTTILGFERGIDTGSGNNSRLRFHDLMIDCKNGIRHKIDLGGAEFVRVRCEPILTGNDANNDRDGVGIEIDGSESGGFAGNDGPVLDSCFAFYRNGFDLLNTNAVKMSSCMSDAPRSVSEGYGLRIHGTSTEGHYSNFRAASHRDGVIVDTIRLDGQPCIHRFEGLNVWQNRDHGLLVKQGHVYVNGGRSARSPAGYQDPSDLGVAICADGPNSVIYIDDFDITAVKVGLQAINGGVIYYGPNVRFGENVSVEFQGDCRPIIAPAKVRRDSLNPRFYPETISPATGVLSLSPNVLRFYPIILPDGYSPNRLEWEVSTTGGDARFGVYSHDAETGGPGVLIQDLGVVTAPSIGLSTLSVSANLLGRKIVWIGALFSATIGVRSGSAGAAFLGGSSITAVVCGYNMAQTFGPMPANVSAATMGMTGDRVLCALYRA